MTTTRRSATLRLGPILDGPMPPEPRGFWKVLLRAERAIRDIERWIETLASYEEGTWIPVLGGSGGTSGQTYATQDGTYIRNGRQVTARFKLVLTAKGTITTNVQLQGLPFAAGEGTSFLLAYFANTATANYIYYRGDLVAAATAATLLGFDVVGLVFTTAVTADINNNTEFAGVVVYEAEDV